MKPRPNYLYTKPPVSVTPTIGGAQFVYWLPEISHWDGSQWQYETAPDWQEGQLWTVPEHFINEGQFEVLGLEDYQFDLADQNSYLLYQWLYWRGDDNTPGGWKVSLTSVFDVLYSTIGYWCVT